MTADLSAAPGDDHGDHEAVPIRGTAYSVEGRNANLPADPRLPWHFPAEAHCVTCGMMIRREQYLVPGDPDKDAWHHTGRKPGEP